MREVRANVSPFCTIPEEAVVHHFEDVFSERLSQLGEPPPCAVLPPTLPQDDTLVEPLSRRSILARLQRCGNTAAGPDNISYKDLTRKDPGAHILHEVLNRCLKEKKIPRTWKEAKTILLYKKGDRALISNWRPISLSNTIYKIYAAVLADRLGRWAATNGAVSRVQKGFMQAEGCMEHNFLLQQCLDDARETGKELTVTWLDLSNAFPSVPHAVILEMMHQHGVHQHLRDVIQDMYKDCTTTLMTANGESRPISMNCGVKQGCPMSPITFNLAVEVLIRSLLQVGEQHGYQLLGHTLTVLAYADDLVLMARSPADMQALLDVVGEVATWIGLRFNASKCATLSMKAKKAIDAATTVQGQRIPCLREGEAYQHLGVPTGLHVDQTPEDTIKSMLQDVRAIERSLLTDWQKLDAVRTFVLPQVTFTLLTARVHKTAFRELDAELKRFAKGALHLPERASNEIVFLAHRHGGAGIMPLGDLADVGVIVHVFKLLTCPDNMVAELAEKSMKKAVQKMINGEPSWAHIVAYLSGEPLARMSNSFATLWSAARNASRRLANKVPGFLWSWSEELQRLGVSVPMPGVQPDRVIVDGRARRQLHSRLSQGIRHHYLRALVAKPDQGKVFEASSRDPSSNHFLAAGRHTRFCDWRFVHRARLGVLPLNGCFRGQRREPERNRLCRRCQAAEETTAHVLNHCMRHHKALNNRHRAVLCRLVENMPADKKTVMRVERAVPGTGSNLKPDLVLLDQDNKVATIIDVACPFENRLRALEEKRAEKVGKYQALCDVLQRQGYATSCDAVLVGSLGAWDPRNERALSLLGIPLRARPALKKKAVSDVIRWSRDLYVEHMTGHRQFKNDVLPTWQS